MPVIEDLKKTVDTTPFFAAVGATDLAVEKVREARLRADKARADFAVRADKARTELSADLAPANVQARATKVADQVREIPALALNQTLVVGGKFAEGYDELAARGHKLVTRLQNQKATKDLVAQADTTVAQVKGAVTSARKATADIERSAKATITTGPQGGREGRHRRQRLRRRGDQGRPGRGHRVGQAHPHRGQAHRTTTKNATKKATTSAKAATTSVRKTAVAAEKATEQGRRQGRPRPDADSEAGHPGRRLTSPHRVGSRRPPVTGFPLPGDTPDDRGRLARPRSFGVRGGCRRRRLRDAARHRGCRARRPLPDAARHPARIGSGPCPTRPRPPAAHPPRRPWPTPPSSPT